jgi:hypothetical protein
MKKVLFFVLLFLVLIPVINKKTLKAQIRDSDVSISVFPNLPERNQDVRVILGGFAVDLDKSSILWTVNGEERLFGIGKKELSFNTGNMSNGLLIQAQIGTPENQTLSKTIFLSNSEVDIIWEAYDVYTPPFYKGKSMVPEEGNFKVVVMPSIKTGGQTTNPRNLSYSWKKDGINQPSSSGWGKSSFVFKNTYLERDHRIDVAVSNLTGETRGTRTINLSPSTPKILFYENDPVLGIKYENTLKNNTFIGQNGIILKAEPYFFSPRNINSSELGFSWFVNNSQIDTPANKNILSIKPIEGSSGTSNLKLEVENFGTLFQKINRSISLNF